MYMLLPRHSISSGCLSYAEGHVMPRNLDSEELVMRYFMNIQDTGVFNP